MRFYVYIIANRPRGAMYVDVTRDLAQRDWARPERSLVGFSTRRRGGGSDRVAPGAGHRVVYYEALPSLLDALDRESVIRGWTRDAKIRHIERLNPDWRDLSATDTDAGDMPDGKAADGDAADGDSSDGEEPRSPWSGAAPSADCRPAAAEFSQDISPVFSPVSSKPVFR